METGMDFTTSYTQHQSTVSKELDEIKCSSPNSLCLWRVLSLFKEHQYCGHCFISSRCKVQVNVHNTSEHYKLVKLSSGLEHSFYLDVHIQSTPGVSFHSFFSSHVREIYC